MNNRAIIHTRDDLINFVCQRVTRRSIARALGQGTIEVLGGFKRVPPKGLPGWCLQAESPITRYKYKLGVTVEPGGIHRVWNLENMNIPWEHWVGDNPAYTNNPLMMGDQPDRYGELKHEATSSEEIEEGEEATIKEERIED